MATVIVGAGIIGCSTAFYLTQPPSVTDPSTVHLVDSSPELFASASGYGAGFLARDWFSDSVAPLGALSFDLHKELAATYNGAGKWGYSRSTATSLVLVKGKRGDEWLREGTSRAETAGSHDLHRGHGPAWLTQSNNGEVEVISQDHSTAQVDPLRLSRFLLATCSERGVQLHQPARPVSVNRDASGTVSSITIVSSTTPQKTTVPCTRLIIAAGAWTSHVFRTLFPSLRNPIPITPLAGHSLLIRSPRWSVGDELHPKRGGCHAVFTTDPSGYCPEIFSRLGAEIYLAGLNSSTIPLPEVATDRNIDANSIEMLKETARKLLGKGEGGDGQDDLVILREGLCFRPVGKKGPIICPVEDETLGIRTAEGGGVWIAAGHGPWGISLSLGTGKVVAEMVEGRDLSADVGELELSKSTIKMGCCLDLE